MADSYWNQSRKWRRTVLTNLTKIANRLRVEAVFPEEFQEVSKLDDAIRFINAYNLQPDLKGKCPLCGEATLTEGEIEDIMFYGIGDAPKWLGKMEGLIITRCENCGAYHIEGW